MPRWSTLLWGLGFVLVGGATALAADPWPTTGIPPGTEFRGPGQYLSLPKVITTLLVFWLWVRTTDWMSYDSFERRISSIVWSPAIVGSFFVGLLLLWMVGSFAIGFTLLMLAYAAPLGVYIWLRNKEVEPQERVLTPAHLRFLAANNLKLIGVKLSAEKKEKHEKGPPLNVQPLSAANPQAAQTALINARQSPGFNVLRQTAADALDLECDGLMVDLTPQAAALRFQIDGVWTDQEAPERQDAEVMLAVAKTLASANPREHRARQQGKFLVDYQRTKYVSTLTTQGTQTGERGVLEFGRSAERFKDFAALGMRPKMQEQLEAALTAQQGLVLLAALPDGGLSTTWHVTIKAMDRFQRNFAAVEDVNRLEEKIENLEVTAYDSLAGESPVTVLPKLIRTYPDVFAIPELVNAETVSLLTEQVSEGRMVIATTRARECVEALLRVLTLKVPPNEFAPAVTAVLCQRLVRKLCEGCKTAYTPPPEVLKQLGIPAGRVESLFRPPPPPEKPKDICQQCGGRGYLGRTAIFEFLPVDEGVRRALVTTPKLDVLRQWARKAGMKTLQEEGIALVARGVTSLTELQRVLKA